MVYPQQLHWTLSSSFYGERCLDHPHPYKKDKAAYVDSRYHQSITSWVCKICPIPALVSEIICLERTALCGVVSIRKFMAPHTLNTAPFIWTATLHF